MRHRERKCEIEKCNEIANRKVYCFDLEECIPTGQILNLCEGHAFILVGKLNPDIVVTCPCCSCMFGVHNDGSKKKVAGKSKDN